MSGARQHDRLRLRDRGAKLFGRRQWRADVAIAGENEGRTIHLEEDRTQVLLQN